MSVAKIPPIADGSWMLLKTMMFAKPWGYELHALLTPQHGAELGRRAGHKGTAKPSPIGSQTRRGCTHVRP